MKTAIIGGGISGLATAFYLRKERPEWPVVVFERDDEPGGTMRTAEVDGFRFERGSNGFLDNKPATLELIRAAGAEHLLLRSDDNARIRFIYHRGALHLLPQSPPAFAKTGLLTWGGKFRVLGELFVKAKKDGAEESLKSFGDRRLGAEFTDVFLNAMSAGIFGSTPEKLCVNAAFPLVVKLEREHGGLFRGMLAKRRKEAGPGGVLQSFVGGVSTFIDHLAGQLDVRTDSVIDSLRREGEGWIVAGSAGEEAFDQVVCATPAFETARLLESVDADLAADLAAIEYSPISVIGLGYRGLAHPLKGFGLLTTAAAGLDVLGVLWDSSIFPDRAPAGCQALRVMVGGQRSPDLALQSDDDLVATAREGIATTMGVTDEPIATFVQKWPRGIPNYQVGHLAAMDRLFGRVDAHPGLFLNSNAYRGIGVNDCVESAKQCAEAMLATA
jgi:oxygen-dependent protoporphyrinogen oxidase